MLLGRSMRRGGGERQDRSVGFFSFVFLSFSLLFVCSCFVFNFFFINIAFVQGSDRGVTLDWLCRALFTLSLLFLLQVEAFLYIMFIFLFKLLL